MGVGRRRRRRRRGWTRRILRRGEVGGVRKAALFLSPFKLVCADIVNMTLLSLSSLLSIPRDNEEEEEGRASISSSRRRRRQMRVGECTHSFLERRRRVGLLLGRPKATHFGCGTNKGRGHCTPPPRLDPVPPPFFTALGCDTPFFLPAPYVHSHIRT